MGLALNLGKCQAVVVDATDISSLAAPLPRQLLFHASGENCVVRDFELLGPAVGEGGFVRDYTAARAVRASPVLAAIAKLDHPQVGLRLLRAAAGLPVLPTLPLWLLAAMHLRSLGSERQHAALEAWARSRDAINSRGASNARQLLQNW